MFRCGNIRREKDEKGRREWVKKEGMRWDSWGALALKKSRASAVRSRNHVVRSGSNLGSGGGRVCI